MRVFSVGVAFIGIAYCNSDAPDIPEGCSVCTDVLGWPCYDPNAEMSEVNPVASPCFSAGPDGKCAEGQFMCGFGGPDFIDASSCGGEDYSHRGIKRHDLPGPHEWLDFENNDRRKTDTRYNFMRIAPGVGAKAMHLVVDWHDQGWGDRKGMIYACYKGLEQRLSPITAPHEYDEMEVFVIDGPVKLFMENADDDLVLSYTVGEGWNHELWIHWLEISFVYEVSPPMSYGFISPGPVSLPITMSYGPCSSEPDVNHVMTMGRTCTDFCMSRTQACVNGQTYHDRWCNAGVSHGCDSMQKHQICTCGESLDVNSIPTPRPTQHEDESTVYTMKFPFGSLMGRQGLWGTQSTGKILVTGLSTLHIDVDGHGSLDAYSTAQGMIPVDFLQVWILDVAAEEQTRIVSVEGSEQLRDYVHHFGPTAPEAGVIIKITSHVSSNDEHYSVDLRVDHVIGSDDTVRDTTNPPEPYVPPTQSPTVSPTTAHPTARPTDKPTRPPLAGISCNNIKLAWGRYAYEVSWDLEVNGGEVVCGLGPDSRGQGEYRCCVGDDLDFVLTLKDSYGDGWNGASLTFEGVSPSVTFASGSSKKFYGTWVDGAPQFGEPSSGWDVCVDAFTKFGSYKEEVSWELYYEGGEFICEVVQRHYDDIVECCAATGRRVSLKMIDSYGDGWNGANVRFGDGNDSVTFNSGYSTTAKGDWTAEGVIEWSGGSFGGDNDPPTSEPTDDYYYYYGGYGRV